MDEEYITSNQNENHLFCYKDVLLHYGVKGMKWGVRKDKAVAKVKSTANKARSFAYKQAGVNNFDELVELTKRMMKDPKGIAFLAAVVLLPDPLVFGGMAAYGALKAKGKLKSEAKHEEVSMNEFKHYGILGMKWGVRRTPEQLGHHKIAKGKKVYRTAPKGDEETSGSTYVSFFPPERDLYKGTWAWGIRQNYGLHKNERLFETEYKLKEDLNIPSREEQIEVFDLLRQTNGEETIKNIVAAELKMAGQTTAAGREDYIHRAKKFNPKPEEMDDDKYNQLISNMYDTRIRNLTESYIEDYKDMTPEKFFRASSSFLGVDKVTKQQIVDELSKRGYNAMIDQASVGGGVRPREGVEPLIIFDKDKTLEPMTTKEISQLEENKAKERYMKWYKTANSARNSKNPW